MKTNPSMPAKQRLSLKEPAGWFAAGSGFQKAMGLLSDGAFKLFVGLCLQADRRTGQVQITYRQLALTMRKSRRVIGVYVRELTQHGICRITAGSNQHAASRFVIADEYWPYHRNSGDLSGSLQEEEAYVAALREDYLILGCGHGRFSPADLRKARQWWKRGVQLQIIKDALLLGTCRKWLAASTEPATVPIGSLQYFEPLLEEVSQSPLAQEYRHYLKLKLEKLVTQHTGRPRSFEQSYE
jgi:hypothetical protein